nr:immunoglobulin heavy chain junction region [Macaca mulatta]MOW46478.1 immunoglobulin heavy chain junction region [Macaca mulatta]MOW46660.1 immunoglobulin heavy chain junction region [Macaca mulatta]MOW46833.1 immunoglobulin heavy chain junction region [Macaca mulatta]MOW47343.1 immunoglobulin heavy chain junction region [Macaca mulatta]
CARDPFLDTAISDQDFW